MSHRDQFLKRMIGYLMSAPDRASIPIRVSPGDPPQSEPNPRREKPLRRVFNRTTSAAFMVAPAGATVSAVADKQASNATAPSNASNASQSALPGACPQASMSGVAKRSTGCPLCAAAALAGHERAWSMRCVSAANCASDQSNNATANANRAGVTSRPPAADWLEVSE